MAGKYTEAQARAEAAYTAKTYKTVLFKFRLDEDADIISDLEESQEHGIKKMDWFRGFYDGSGVSLSKVRKTLEKYDVDPRIADKIIDELK